jgi:hypothetical protein
MSYISRITVMLAGCAGAVLAVSTTTPPAYATLPPPVPGGTKAVPSPAVHTIVIGGMPGWQITIIAAGAALLAAVLAVIADRTWTTHRRQAASA